MGRWWSLAFFLILTEDWQPTPPGDQELRSHTVEPELVEVHTVPHIAEEEEEEGGRHTALHSYGHRHNPPVQLNLK